MRLLKTGPYVPGFKKLELIQKWGADVPPYAILSHTWSTNPDDEVLFADVQDGTCARKPAYSKLVHAMERAELDGYGWLWIDTCCIDKTSSVELSEAINSMYAYYRDAQKCYAYLIDVAVPEPVRVSLVDVEPTSTSQPVPVPTDWHQFDRAKLTNRLSKDAEKSLLEGRRIQDEFMTSRWFKRGWCLQELIAPRRLEFFTAGWKSLGVKHGLNRLITLITGIENEYLSHNLPVEHASIAKRMSWAASRQTTREEDLAYCLIGLFDVNMPMLYGEGHRRAFARLQEEIMKNNEDQSLFAWIQDRDDTSNSSGYHGLLADHPRNFRITGATKAYTELTIDDPSVMTARGLKLTLPLTPKSEGVYIAALQCPVAALGNSGWLAVYLRKMPTGPNQYARIDCNKLASVSELGQHQQIYVRQQFPNFSSQLIYPYHFFQIRSLLVVCNDHPELADYRIVQAWSVLDKAHCTYPSAAPQAWSDVPLTHLINKKAGALAVAYTIRRTHDQESFTLLLGAQTDFTVAFSLANLETLRGETDETLQSWFFPNSPGQFLEMEYHKVRVSMKEHVRADQKIYFVDIEIHALPAAPTALDLLDDVVDAFVGQDKRAAKSALRDKVKRYPWRKKSDDGRQVGSGTFKTI